MKKTLSFLCAAVSLWFTSGCVTGSAGEAHVKFGIPGIFAVEKNATEAKLTANGYREASGDTKVSILLFSYESSAKDFDAKKPREPKEPKAP